MPTYQLGLKLYANPDAGQIETLLRKGGFLVPDAPSHNAATHHAPRWDVGPMTNAAENWIVTAKSVEELAALADAADRLTKRGLVAQAIPWLRERAAAAAGTTATSGNAVAVLNAMLDDFAVFYDRFADLLEAQRMDQ